MDEDATKCSTTDKKMNNASINESDENEGSESTATEPTETETTVSMTGNNVPDKTSFQTEAPGSSASGQTHTGWLVYLQHQESFDLPSYGTVQELNTLQPIQDSHSRGRNTRNKNENIRLTETSDIGRSCQRTHLERRTYEETQKRIDSFVNCSYQHQLPQAVTLAEAGFYFTDNDVIRCFACGIEFKDWKEQDIAWEWHARSSSYCSHIEAEGKRYFELQYLDLKSNKKQDLGRHRNQLKQWLLCKLCYLNISNLVLLPCGHVCLCIECADKVTVCPTCDIHIRQHVQASFEI